MKTIIAIACLTLAACTSASKTHTPDGKVGHSINCSGNFTSWGGCYEKAGALCGAKGYTVLAGGTEHGAAVGGTQGSFFGGTTATRNMLINCKD